MRERERGRENKKENATWRAELEGRSVRGTSMAQTLLLRAAAGLGLYASVAHLGRR